MYAGLIPIITREVGQSELIPRSLNFLILENNNPKTIAKKILEIHNLSEAKKRSIVAKCRELAKRHSREKSIKSFKKALYKLLTQI